MLKENINERLKKKISKYMSYLLRHDPKNLKINNEGFVKLDNFVALVQKRYTWLSKANLIALIEENDRYEVENDRIRAIYGHSINVTPSLKEASVDKLFHGTSEEAAEKILREGLQPMHRKKVHLSTTIKDAIRVGRRKAKNPVILEINVSSASLKNIKFEKGTEKVFVTDHVPPEHIKKLKANQL